MPGLKEAQARAARYIGVLMKDGTIFAGISPDTLQPLYAAPTDSPVLLDFNQAAKYARQPAYGHNDWRLPTKDELGLLFEHKEKGALAGTFNLFGLFPVGWYRSISSYNGHHMWEWGQIFSSGKQTAIDKTNDAAVRCVREGEWPDLPLREAVTARQKRLNELARGHKVRIKRLRR